MAKMDMENKDYILLQAATRLRCYMHLDPMAIAVHTVAIIVMAVHGEPISPRDSLLRSYFPGMTDDDLDEHIDGLQASALLTRHRATPENPINVNGAQAITGDWLYKGMVNF